MKEKLLRLVFLSIFFTTASLTHATPEKLVIDNKHSYVLWSLEHHGFSTQTGKWFVDGTIVADKDKPENSRVDAVINIKDMVTGIPDLDKHLEGKEFFDAAQFPKASFVSNKIEVTGKDTGKIHGTLTIRGISKPVVLDAKLNKIAESPITHKMTAGFSASTEIKRSDFGINTYLPTLGDNVKIQIAIEAYKPTENQA
ncbi:MAG: YceI family protein [Proteobacteria bacterium]|nr:YceI family protein [Pseudomonadota bacterium]